MYEAIPALDYSFNRLPWRRRVRTFLSYIDFDKVNDPEISSMRSLDKYALKTEIDEDLDAAFWNPNSDIAWRKLNALMAKYAILSREHSNLEERKKNHAKFVLIQIAKNNAFSGISNHGYVPRWKTYMLEFITEKDGRKGHVLFTSEDYDQTFDWVLEALLNQEEEVFNDFKWSVYHLYHCPYNNPAKKIDITQAFWNYAYPIAEDPMSKF